MQDQMLSTTIGQFLHSNATVPESATVNNPDEARDVAKKFEALLINTMLKNMRDATPEGGLLNNEHANMYMEMFDKHIAQEISDRGTFGLQESLYRQLTAQSGQSSVAAGLTLNNAALPAVNRTRVPSVSGLLNQDMSPGGFVDRMRSAATQTAQKLGTSVEAIIAVAALETGWGKKVATTADGRSTFNLFGIKSDSRWQGDSSEVQTREFRQGQFQTERAAFRVYGNELESIRDFGQFLIDNPRYRKALEVAGDGEQFIRELQEAGYATDPDYAEKVISIMKSVTELVNRDNSQSI